MCVVTTELWAGTTDAVAPERFKWVVARYAPRFAGYDQHDSQEFLAYVLDGNTPNTLKLNALL